MSVFFSAKTHKPDVPFRAITSERHSWQVQVSSYLARQLAQVNVQDPYKILNSAPVCQYLEHHGSNVTSGFSIDIKDMYYSIPHNSLLPVLRTAIEEDGPVLFQNAAGISIDTFLELLAAYVGATIVSFQDSHYTQRSGIAIGSRVAPYLCDIFLAFFGKQVNDAFADDRVLAIYRYGDDFLVLCNVSAEADEGHYREKVLESFKGACPTLTFTHEVSEEQK